MQHVAGLVLYDKFIASSVSVVQDTAPLCVQREFHKIT